MAEPTDLLLVDGHSLLFRAFFALPPMTTPEGIPSNAVYGFTSMMMTFIQRTQPKRVIVAFDPHGPTFRTEEYAEYKGTRPDAPVEFRPQVALCHTTVEAFGIPIVEVPGFEADDVIGTLATQADAAGMTVTIVTGDMDALQLVNGFITVASTKKGMSDIIYYNPDGVVERYGFGPEFVVDYKSLAGDSSDNIPGVPSIGAKTATMLITTYGHLDDIYAALPTMKESRATKALTQFREQAYLSYRLATIRRDVPLDVHALDSPYTPVIATVHAAFQSMGFNSLISRMPKVGVSGGKGAAEAETPAQPLHHLAAAESHLPTVGNVITPGDEKAIKSFMKKLHAALNTASVILHHSQGTDWYVGIDGNDDILHLDLRNDTLDFHEMKTHLLSCLEHDGPTLTDDLKVLIKLVDDPHRSWETYEDLLIEGGLATTEDRIPGIDRQIEEYLGHALDRPVTGKHGASPEEIDEYHGLLTLLMPELHVQLRGRLMKETMISLYDTIERPLIPLLAQMELSGIALDVDVLKSLSQEMYTSITGLETQIHELAGTTFNIASTQQLAKVLFDDLGLAAGRKTKTGRSTDADTLDMLKGTHPIIDHILEWRMLSKLKNTYVDALPLLADRNSRVHTSYNQLGAITGRLSSTDPNLQNIPVRTAWGNRIRGAFIASPGNVLVSADYSQIELRILAHFSEDPNLVTAFKNDEDIHRRTAAEVYGIDPKDVTPDMRRIAKVVNFGILYGLSEFGLARDTGMNQQEAKAYITDYFARFPEVRGYLEGIKEQARRDGWVGTLLGRRRYFSEINSRVFMRRAGAERMAINMPLQGSAADIVKKAMLDVDRELKHEHSTAVLLLQVHDEIVVEVPENDLAAYATTATRVMEHAVELRVPLRVDVKYGTSWGAMTPWKEGISVPRA